MTSSVLQPLPGAQRAVPLRAVAPRHYLMCPPTYFDVRYVINPWMDPSVPVDTARAVEQWTALVENYRAAGHRVDLLEPVPGLPDMVFAANGATVVDGQVLQARFANRQRRAEAGHHLRWHQRQAERYPEQYPERRTAAASGAAAVRRPSSWSTHASTTSTWP